MSGPKDYAPPTYSMSAFDGKLNQVFRLQSQVKMLRDEIARLEISDHELNIVFDCRRDLDGLASSIDEVLRAVIFDYRGTFGQETYDRIDRELNAKLQALTKTASSCEGLKVNFADKKEDYESYRSYLQFHENSGASFEAFRKKILNYLESNLKESAPDILRDGKDRINEIRFEKEASSLEFGFASRVDVEKDLVITYSVQKEQEINRIRAEVSDQVIGLFRHAVDTAKLADTTRDSGTEEANQVADRIEALLINWENSLLRDKYRKTLQKLNDSQSLTDSYFLKELHDSILDEMNAEKTKTRLTALLGDLNNRPFHPSTQPALHGIITSCVRFIESSSVREDDLNALLAAAVELEKRSSECLIEDEIKRKEHLFLKSQLILCLENRGYEVMDDLEVIDFEQESDFLLKIDQQENYLNLKFRDDGSMRYVFQIPEDCEQLSTDQKNTKLHEMKVTCDEFASVLKDLAGMGLKIDLRKERAVEVDSLISVPARDRAKVRSRGGRKTQDRVIRKKYLDR